MIESGDIGAFGALAFAQPTAWLGRTVELAGDELTMLQIAGVLSRVTSQFTFVRCRSSKRAFEPTLAVLSEWLNSESYHADIPALRASYPGMTDLEMWLQQTGWAQPGA
jgi:hypothetical protein